MGRLSIAKQKKGRGRNKGDQPKTNPAERPVISTDGIDGFVDPLGSITRTIGCILKRHVTGPYTTWNKVPPDGQEKYWNVFKETYRWDPENEHLVRQIFKKKSAVLMHKMFSLLHKEWRAKNKTPDWLTKEHFNGLIAYWNTDAFKRRSAASEINRLKGQKITHSGGSKPSARKNLDAEYMDEDPVSICQQVSASGPVITEQEIIDVLLQLTLITTMDLVTIFRSRLRLKEEKEEFAATLKNMCRLQKIKGREVVVLKRELHG